MMTIASDTGAAGRAQELELPGDQGVAFDELVGGSNHAASRNDVPRQTGSFGGHDAIREVGRSVSTV